MKATKPEKLWLQQVLSYNFVIVQPYENSKLNRYISFNEMDGRRELPAVLLLFLLFSSSKI